MGDLENWIVEELENWIIEKNIIERVKSGFWRYIDNYRSDDFEEFENVFKNIDVKCLKIQICKIGLIVNYSFDEPVKYVLVESEIEYNEEDVGIYKSIFLTDGSDMDDYLKIDNVI